MSDPRYTDPRLGDPPIQDDVSRNRPGELERSNTMWGWVAGGIVLALLLVFVFGRSPTPDQASTSMTAPPPGQSTLVPPSDPPRTPTVQTPASPPSTTGQGAQ